MTFKKFGEMSEQDLIDALNKMHIKDEVLTAEAERAAGLGSQSGYASWINVSIGRQIFQFVPYQWVDETGEVGTDWSMVCHVHRPSMQKGEKTPTFISSNAKDLSSAVREKFPGWQYVCARETFKRDSCQICNEKWDIGKFLKQHTKEGWKHELLKDTGIWPQQSARAMVLPVMLSGNWLKTKEGVDWATAERSVLGRGKQARKALEMFNRMHQEAIQSAGRFEGKDLTPVMCELPKDLYFDIAARAKNEMYGKGAIGSPINGLQFVITISIDGDTAKRKYTVEVHLQKRHLVSNSDGSPNYTAIAGMLDSIPRLREMRDFSSPEIEEAVEQRLLQIWEQVHGIVEGNAVNIGAAPKIKEYEGISKDDDPAEKEGGGAVDKVIAAAKARAAEVQKQRAKEEEEKAAAADTRGDVKQIKLVMEPTEEVGEGKLRLCFGQGLSDPSNSICKECSVRFVCDSDESSDGGEDDDSTAVIPF